MPLTDDTYAAVVKDAVNIALDHFKPGHGLDGLLAVTRAGLAIAKFATAKLEAAEQENKRLRERLGIPPEGYVSGVLRGASASVGGEPVVVCKECGEWDTDVAHVEHKPGCKVALSPGGVSSPAKHTSGTSREQWRVKVKELIAKLEAASGPDRVLEQDIWHALGLCQKIVINGEPAGCADYHAPHFTSSIDAAVSLVPEGWSYAIEPWFHTEYSSRERRDILFMGHCIKPNWEKATPMDTDPDFLTRISSPQHISAAIALVIAALKARSHD